MMSKFSFEDFQMSWKTDRHKELKKEFMERYKNTFNEEKLSYLAEVYVNVILMNCRYPESLMKEIRELSKPLQMGKQFEDTNSNIGMKRLINEQEETEKSSMHEHFKRPSKQLKTFASEGQCRSTFPSTNPLLSLEKKFSDVFSVPLKSKEGTHILLKLKQVLKASVDLSKRSSEQINFCTTERQFNSTGSLASTNVPSMEQFRNPYLMPFYSQQDSPILSTSEPVYKTLDHSRPFKQGKFYANEEQSSSTLFSADTDVLQPSAEQFRNTYSVPFLEEQGAENLSKTEQALRRSIDYSEKLIRQINFPANERQTSSKFSSPYSDEFHPPMEQFRNRYSIPFSEEHVSQNLSKSEQILKKSIEHSKTHFKQINCSANGKQSGSSFLSTSFDVLQPSLEEIRNAHAIPFFEEHDAKILSVSEQGLKKSGEHSEIPFKQMSLCDNEGQSSSGYLSPSSNVLQSSEEQFQNKYSISFYNEQNDKILSKSKQIRKKAERLSERSFKEINCVEEGQSNSTISTNMLQHSIKDFRNIFSMPLDNEQNIQILPKSAQTFETSLDEIKEPLYQFKDIFIEKKKADNIISSLGLSFIQKFAELAKSCVTRFSSPVEILQHTCLKLKIWTKCSFVVDKDPDSPIQAALYHHKFFLNGCLIANETAMNKKKGRPLIAEAALNTLVKLATFDRNKASQIYEPTPKKKKPLTDNVKLFNIFSKNVINRTKDEPAIIAIKSIASLLDVEDYVVFKEASNIVNDHETEYTSKLFLNGILISFAKDVSVQSSKNIAAEFALVKLSNLEEYVIHKGELKNRLVYLKDVHSASSSSKKASSTCNTERETTFVLNKKLFDSSVRDGIMLFQRDRVQINLQKNLRDVIIETASFCQEQFYFDIEEVSPNIPAYRKAKVRIGMVEVGAGVAFSRDEAKTIACIKAFINMQRKYYTLRVKDEYIEGFLVTLDQVMNGESYSKNKLKKKFLGLKKITRRKSFHLKFSGKDKKDSVEVTAKQSSNNDQELCTETKSSNIDIKSSITDSKTTVTDIKLSSTDIEPSCIDTSVEDSTEKPRTDFNVFVEKLEIMLQKFQESEDYCDILFSEEFTPIHKRLIVKTAKKLHLRYVFLTEELKAYVCVRHKYDATELLKFLVKNGGSNCKFELIDASKTLI